MTFCLQETDNVIFLIYSTIDTTTMFEADRYLRNSAEAYLFRITGASQFHTEFKTPRIYGARHIAKGIHLLAHGNGERIKEIANMLCQLELKDQREYPFVKVDQIDHNYLNGSVKYVQPLFEESWNKEVQYILLLLHAYFADLDEILTRDDVHLILD